MFYVPQIQKDDCGYACLKMLLANVQKDKNFLFLPQDEEHGAYSYQQLIAIASKYGVKLEGYSVESKFPSLKEMKKYPYIVTIKTQTGNAHCVLVYKVMMGRVYYLDPRIGKADMSIRKFSNLWDGTFLQVEEKEIRSAPYKEAKPLSYGHLLVLTLLEVAVAISTVVGIFFINDDAYVFIPIMAFAVAVVFELLAKAYSVSLMKKVDIFFYGQVEVKDNKYLKTLERFEKYKKSLLANPLQFVLTLVIAMGIMLAVLLNDINNFILIAAPFIASLFEAFFYRPYQRNGFLEVSEYEQALDLSEDEEDFQGRIEDLHKKSYRLGLLEMSKQYVGLALFIAMAIVLLAINGSASVPHAVFYVCIEIAIYLSFSRLLSYPEKMDEMLKAKVEINNCLHQEDENE